MAIDPNSRPDSPPRAWWHSHLPALIAAGWIFLDLILLATGLFPKERGPSDWWVTIVLGLVFAQLSFGGLWGAFGPGKAALRIPLILSGTALVIAGFFRQFVFDNQLELWLLGFFLSVLLLFQILVVGLGVMLQRLLGWYAAWEGTAPATTATQFGVRDILYWMAGVGVLLVLFRFTFGTVGFNVLLVRDLGPDFVIGCVILASTLAQTFLAAWSAFPRPGTSHRWLAGLIVSPLLAAFCAVPIGAGWGSVEYLIVAALLILQYVILWGQLAFLHSQGLRLVDDSGTSP